jgi:mRNA interferase YafQ
MKDLIHSKHFKKDFKRINKRGFEIKKLSKVIQLLRKTETLDKKYKPHKIIGEYKDYMECHIEPDWLLVYKTNENLVTLYRTGSHSDLF